MKLSGQAVDRFLQSPDPKRRFLLVYGPDRGLVRERCEHLVRLLAGSLDDPFRIALLESNETAADPARLADESAALSLVGGNRVVWVRGAGDSLTSAVEDAIAGSGNAWIIVEGADLSTRSSLRRAFESSNAAVAIPCYADEGLGLRRVVDEALREHGLSASDEGMAYLLSRLGSDRSLTRSEMEKLCLYMGSDPGPIDVAHVAACVGDAAPATLVAVAHRAASGDQATLALAVERAFQEGATAVSILRRVLTYFRRLHLARGHVDGGAETAEAMRALRPPVFFKEADAFRMQLRQWNLAALGRVLDRLVEAEISCKTTGLPAEEMCARTVHGIAATARSLKSRVNAA